MAQKIVHKHSAGGLVFQDGKVLLIHWDPPRGSYDFPKGSIERRETPEQTCVREVLEETGYYTKIIAPIGQTYYEYEWTDGSYHKKTVDYFLLELDEARAPRKAKLEFYERFHHEWVDIEEAAKLLTRDIDKEILRKARLLRDVS